MAKRSQSATSELLARRHLLVEGFSRTTADAVGSAFEGALIARRALLVAGFAGERFSGDGSAETTGFASGTEASVESPRHSAFMMRRPCDQSAQRVTISPIRRFRLPMGPRRDKLALGSLRHFLDH